MTEEHKSETIFGNEDKHFFLDFDLSYLGSNSDSESENQIISQLTEDLYIFFWFNSLKITL